jgi:hypothetical protein
MATTKQREAARKNIRKAQAAWRFMSHQQHARAQPQGGEREKPGTQGGGDYYRVRVRPKKEFVTFRTHRLGEHIQRIAGKRSSGSWDTQTWLIGKEDAHVEDRKLVGDTPDARKLLQRLGAEPKHVRGDIFEAKPQRKIPESEKPTPAQQRARRENIKKARATRHAHAT